MTRSPVSSPRPLNQTHAAASRVLAESFCCDPLMRAVFGSHSRPVDLMSKLYKPIIRYCELYGEFTLHSSEQGAIGWLPAICADAGPVRLARSGLFAAPILIGPTAFWRLAAHERRCMSGLREQLKRTDTAYLWFVGVRLEARREGIGRALVDQALEVMGKGHDRCVLKTENEDNLSFYQKLGFKIIRSRPPLPGQVRWWGLERAI